MNFADLIAHLGTLARNTVTTSLQKGHSFTLHTRPTAIQEAAFLPSSNGRKRLRRANFSRPNLAMSVIASAPAMTASKHNS